ncbi:hypothetical protein LINGRAHAP2_LOCUS2831 [Linum grandiflorum]
MTSASASRFLFPRLSFGTIGPPEPFDLSIQHVAPLAPFASDTIMVERTPTGSWLATLTGVAIRFINPTVSRASTLSGGVGSRVSLQIAAIPVGDKDIAPGTKQGTHGSKCWDPVLVQSLRAMWKPEGRHTMVDLDHGVFLASFEDLRDYDFTLTGALDGPSPLLGCALLGSIIPCFKKRPP